MTGSRNILVIAAVLMVFMGAGAYFASRRAVPATKPPAEPPAFLVTAPATGRPSENERDVAIALEDALYKTPGVKRVRTRVTATEVRAEVWAPPTTQLSAPGAKVVRLDVPELTWVVRGTKRPIVDGTVCGVEDELIRVALDPLKLTERHVGALDVAKALEGKPRNVETLRDLDLTDQVKLKDVASLDVGRPPPTCLAYAGDDSVWLVTTRQRDVSGGVELERPAKIRMHLPGGRSPVLAAATPAVVSVDVPDTVTYWFSPALDAIARAKVIGELRRFPEQDHLEQIDGMRRVRLVLSGDDRSLLLDIAGTVAATLRHAAGVELVVPLSTLQAELDFDVDKERAAQLNVPAADVARLAELALRSETRDGVRLSIELGNVPEHLAALTVADHRLGELVKLVAAREPAELLRENRRRAVELFAYGIDRRGVPMPALPAGVTLEIYEEL